MGTRLVVVDDDPSVAKIVRRIFERERFSVDVVDDCVDLVPLLLELAPDVLVIDVNLPSGDGRKLVAAARADVRIRSNLVIVGWTAADLPRERPAGFDAFYSKPFDVGTLVEEVEALLTKAATYTDASGELSIGERE